MFTPVTNPADVATLESQVATLQAQTLSAVQAANQAKTNDTLADSDLSVAILAGATYSFDIVAPFTLAGIISGVKFAIACPASPAIIVWTPVIRTSLATSLLGVVQTAAGSVTNALATADNHTLFCSGTIVNGVNAGNLKLQFAQSVTDAGALTLLRGARMIVRRLA